MNNKVKKKFLLISALHGDEGFSVEILKSLERMLTPKKFGYEWIVANPKAFRKNIRFIEADLNRCAPGNIKSYIYEERRAAELIKLSSKYKFAIDIHGTNAKSGIFLIITNPSVENLFLAASLPIKNVVIWTAKESLVRGPITQYAKCPALEIECGPKDSQKRSEELKSIIKKIILNPYPTILEIFKNIKRQNYFVVYGKEENIKTAGLKEFKKTHINGEEFYPMLIDAYQKGSVRKMKKLDLFNSLSY